MAVNYTNLFTDIGKFIKLANQLRMLAVGAPLGAISQADLTGQHTGAGSTTVVTRLSGTWTASSLIGLTIRNVTDGSVGVITANTTTTATCANGLSGTGATDDAWESGDVFEIDQPLPDLVAHRNDIFTQLEASGKENILDGMFSLFDSQRDVAISMAQSFAAKVNDLLLDRDTVINELSGVVSLSNLSDVIGELGAKMLDDGEDVNGSAITIGSWTLQTSAGEATIENTVMLDGFSAPASGFQSHDFYSGVESQLAVPSELMTLTVTTDRDTNGIVAGHETWLLEGQPGPSGALGWRSEGSGTSVSIPSLNSYDIITNRNFETFTANIPNNWTAESGAGGMEFTSESAAADVFRGSTALGLNGTSTDAELRQAVANQAISPDRWYRLTVQVRGDAAMAGATLTIAFVSDSGGYTASSTEKIEMNNAALVAQVGAKSTWHEGFDWLTPKNIPDDLELSIKLSGATAGKVVIDSLAFGPYLYANGIGFAISAREDTPGSSKQNVIGDRYTATVTNNEGIFQRFFRRYLKVQLPFVIDGTETQADDLAA